MQDRESRPLGARGDEQVRERHRAMLGRRGQQCLDGEGAVDHGLGHRHAGHRPQCDGQFRVRGWARGAEEQFEVNDPARGDAAGEQQWLDHLAHLRAGVASRQCALVGQKGRHAASLSARPEPSPRGRRDPDARV